MFVEVRGYFISVLWLSTKKQRGSDTVRQQWIHQVKRFGDSSGQSLR